MRPPSQLSLTSRISPLLRDSNPGVHILPAFFTPLACFRHILAVCFGAVATKLPSHTDLRLITVRRRSPLKCPSDMPFIPDYLRCLIQLLCPLLFTHGFTTRHPYRSPRASVPA